MVYKYFLGVINETQLTAKYKSLAKTLHPDVGGKHEDFVAMKAEYEHIQIVEMYPVANISSFREKLANAMNNAKYPKTPEESLSPEQLNHLKATSYFNTKRFADLTYDVIDDILKKQQSEKLNKLWAYQELQKQYSLELDHFKYLAWKLGDPITVAHSIYKKYQLV